MKRIAILLAFLATSATALLAQNLSVKGTVYDFDSGDVLSPAAVQIYQIAGTDSTYIGGASTDDDGVFVVNNLSAGNFRAKFTFIGYDDVYKNFTLRSGSGTTDLGKITMRGGQMLDEVAINAVVAKVQMINDTVMFNSAAYKLPEGSSVEDLIRKLPGVQIGSDGNITVNGKSVAKILVNGKEFFSDDKTVALTQLTADMIEKVKAYEKQSDLARQTGIDDGEEQTVLDLQVKKGMAKGWFGNLSVGGGAPLEKEGFDLAALYQVNASLNRFDEDKQFTLMGSASQSSGGMSGMGGMRMGGGVGMGMGGMGMGGGFGGMSGGGSGVSTSYSGGFNFAMNLGKEISSEDYEYEVGGSLNWSHNDNQSQTKSNTERWDEIKYPVPHKETTYSNVERASKSGSNSLNGQMRLEWNKNIYTSLLVTPSITYSEQNSNSYNNNRSFKDRNPFDYAWNPLDDSTYYSAIIPGHNPNNLDLDPAASYLDSLYDAMWNSQTGSSMSTSINKSANITGQFVRRFGNRGRNVSLRGTYQYNSSTSDQNELNQNFSKQETMKPSATNPGTFEKVIEEKRDTTRRFNQTPSSTNNWSAQVTYTEPIGTGTYLQFSYQLQSRTQYSDRSTYDLGAAYAQWGLPLNDPVWDLDGENYKNYVSDSLGRKQLYENLDQTIQLQFRKNATDQKYNFTVGLSILPQYSRNMTRYLNQERDYDRMVYNWTPTVQFRYRVTRQEQIQFNYNGRSAQPSMDQMLDIEDNTNRLSIRKGNPNLEPTFSHNLRLNYNKYDPVTMSSITVGGNFGNTLNQIATVTRRNADLGSYSTYTNMTADDAWENFFMNWNSSLNVNLMLTLPSDDRFSFNAGANATYRKQTGWASYQQLDPDTHAYVTIESLRKTQSVGVSPTLSAEYRDDYLTISLDGNLSYQHQENDQNKSQNMDTYDYRYGTSVMAYIPWRNMRLGSDLNMNSRRGYSGDMNRDELIWNASLSFSFLKGNKASLSLAAYDILHQRSTVSRQMSTTSRTDTETKNITSYFMATLTYRLSLMGDRNSRQQLRGRGGMGGFGGGFGGFGGGMGGGMPMGGMPMGGMF